MAPTIATNTRVGQASPVAGEEALDGFVEYFRTVSTGGFPPGVAG